MTTIYNEGSFKGLSLYDQKKASLGFHEEILAQIYQLALYAKNTWSRPQVCHLVIDQPKEGAAAQLYRSIERWSQQRHRGRDGIAESHTLYVACKEIQPRLKQEHLHVAVFANNLRRLDYELLEERLACFSKTNQAKLYKRKFACLPVALDPATGEILLNKRGEFARKGSIYFHDLKREFEDAFYRLSYLAKVFSKTALSKSKCWSASRITANNGRGAAVQHASASEMIPDGHPLLDDSSPF